MAKKAMNPVTAIFLGAVLVLGILFATGTFSQKAVGGDLTIPSGCGDSTGILTLNVISALTGGTDPTSPTITCGVNGGAISTAVTSGETTFPIGSELECLVSKSDYIDTTYTGTMACGGLVDDVKMFYSTSDNPSIRIKNDDGDFMTDSATGGAINQTDVTTGETINLDVEIQGTNGESSGDGIYIIEFPANSNANISSVTLGGNSPISLPTVHNSVNAGSKIVAFDVSGVEGANKETLTLSIVLGSGKDLAGGVLTDWYGKQNFIDQDKTIQDGIEDSEGNAKYENTLDYDFYIN